MVSWHGFAQSDPELAALIERRFEPAGVVLLGTIRADGWPRISPIEYTLFEGELVLGGMWRSRKFVDLLRDSRCTLHSATSDKSGRHGDAKLWGQVRFVTDAAWAERYWDHIFAVMNWRPTGPAHITTVDIQSAAYVVFDGDGTMRWKTWPGGQWLTRADGA